MDHSRPQDLEQGLPSQEIEPKTASLSTDNEDNDTEAEEFRDLIASLQNDSTTEAQVDGVKDKDEKEHRRASGDELQTNIKSGLSTADVKTRRSRYGPNSMREERQNSILKFLHFFVGPIQTVMELAAVLAAALKDWIDLGVIAGLLLLNATVGFVQEAKAGSIVDELKKGLAQTATVIRDSQQIDIDASELVPGDIMVVEEGCVLAADGKLVTPQAHLQIDQSAITGESMAVDRYTGDECYASSIVKRGDAKIIVTATGDDTTVGRTAALVNSAATRQGHFTEVLHGIGNTLLVLVVLTLAVVWIAAFSRHHGIMKVLESTLAILIVGVPVGLPAVVTTTMAVGAAFLAKKKAIVQKLTAIESLAGVEVLCSDKTGTLTKNQLSLAEPFVIGGVDPDSDLMLTACLAASRKVKGLDAIDKAFLKSLTSYPKALRALTRFTVRSFQPFDPVTKRCTSEVISPDGEQWTCMKGAPKSMLNFCVKNGGVSNDAQDQYDKQTAEYAERGFRSLGIARKRGTGSWELLGIMPLSDPPRHDTAETINEARHLGLKVKMLTGDAIGIAKETCRQLGLGTNVYNAERLGVCGRGSMSGSELFDYVEGADGFAEVFPEHKNEVVEILQSRGYLVAMTGDGVNDAPSLKRSDTGIAVEGATDAARSAADIVFLAPGLSAIIDAIKTSRQIFHRMYAYIVYRIALSIHLEIFLGFWIACGLPLPGLNLALVVFIAIFADIATLMIAYDRAPYSPTPVKWNLSKLWGMSIALGFILAAGTYVCWALLGSLQHDNDDRYIISHGGLVHRHGDMQQILFLEIALTQNWLILVTRNDGPIWKSIPSWQLTGAVLAVDIVATLFCYFGLFTGGRTTDWVTIAQTWVFSLFVLSVLALAYYIFQTGDWFDYLMHFPERRRAKKTKAMEDFAAALQKVSIGHEVSDSDEKTQIGYQNGKQRKAD